MWVKSLVNENADKRTTESDVVMVAHYESCHDCVLLLKAVINWVWLWRFSDTLPIFKVVIQPDLSAKLCDLVFTYTPWFTQIEHDASSDAGALRAVVTKRVANWQVACYAFSIPCSGFARDVGLNVVSAEIRFHFQA